jgi:diguanylate cyclase (GGDEF)-like protein
MELPMFRAQYLRDVAINLALAAAYFLSGELGLHFALLNATATAIWPCAGIALAGLLIFGYRALPGIFLGSFLTAMTTPDHVLTAFGVATGGTLEAVAGCYLVNRFASGKQAFERAQDIFKFALLAGLASPAISATIGVTSTFLGGFVSPAAYGSVWSTWLLGDAAGAIIATPLILLWVENPSINRSRKHLAELACLFGGLIFTSWIVFAGGFHSVLKDYPLEYLYTPFLVWAAFRFGRRYAVTANFVLAAIATWGTANGFGPFSRPSLNASLLLLQVFIGIMAVTTLALAAEVTEHRRADERVRQLAVTDPLTGLANYRRLLDALDLEIKRSERTGRPFAILLLDLDGLKILNDAYGHVVGSRAICRLANTLLVHCREVDLAARYGGDEFVLVLPETEMEAALQVAQRISERLKNDGELPKLSVSTGAAVYSGDSQSLDELLSAADHALYREKDSFKSKQGSKI